MQDSRANWLPSSVANSWHCTSVSPYEFIPCLQFEGSKPGFVFKHAQLGTGYYLDSPDASARAGSGGDGNEQEDAHDGGGGVWGGSRSEGGSGRAAKRVRFSA
jgi:hypothetical protein